MTVGIWFVMALPAWVLGVLLAGGGAVLLRWPPRKIDPVMGYSTPVSRRSQAHWDLAQRLAGRALLALGLAQVVLGFGAFYVPFRSAEAVLGVLRVPKFVRMLSL